MNFKHRKAKSRKSKSPRKAKSRKSKSPRKAKSRKSKTKLVGGIRKSYKEDKNKPMWLIYAKDGCPYCEKAMDMLEKYNISYTVLDKSKLSNDWNVGDYPKDLQKRKDFNTWPKIFMGATTDNVFVGGYGDLKKFFEKILHV
jgi:glutaredoxin